MNLFVATLNVGNKPLEPDQLNRWLREAKSADVCVVNLQEAHVVTDRDRERTKTAGALLAAAASAWWTFGISCCLALPFVCRQRDNRRRRHRRELEEARALSNPSLSPRQKRARVTLGSSRRIRDCMAQLGFGVRKKPSLAWGQLRLLVFAKRDVSVLSQRRKDARVGGRATNHDLRTGVLGNKGGLISTFVVEKAGFAATCTAINAHLPAHEGRFPQRMAALEAILKKARAVTSAVSVLAGDLNWRLEPDEVWDGGVERCMQSGDWRSLRSADELVRARAEHSVLSDWTVPACEFPPTFKLKPRSQAYDPKRLPAWCDRVLFRGAYACDVLSHRSCPGVDTSDHRPVGLMLRVRDPAGPESRMRRFGTRIRRSFGRSLLWMTPIDEDDELQAQGGGRLFTSTAGPGGDGSDGYETDFSDAGAVSASSDDEVDLDDVAPRTEAPDPLRRRQTM